MKPSDDMKHLIENCGLTRYQLAQVSGVSEAVLSLFVTGKRSLTLTTVDRLAAALGLRIVGKKAKNKPRKQKATRAKAAPSRR